MSEHNSHPDHGSLKSYMTGFVLSVILTAIPFWLVMANVIESAGLTALIILAFAAVQIFVHMIYFLHMSPKSEGGWNLLALVFTLILVFIALAGSIWVMYNLNVNMMPGMMSEPVMESQNP
ncbi:cytochrome o ubiquinol oxidase subunit IV [Marinobacter sp.]|jgi:cytochrome o ubiquinol oxidase subunit IV|uniref:cytochrome o ubiquinol oxidase subunit IV n=1 Tax=Marinobacter sp. TaxID=50741 RepID=UPI000C4D909D|nr:cytochrome o ubiquinol oxidase subunit IV [Marinobacter sp.]MBE94830.1 cytochrome o ubiquinol oxidase subunit IV [Marinobacter sp.]|tara:strand:- start:157 stop:519 length:363 start_codon:yes stop_codon:yes gene_type:complete